MTQVNMNNRLWTQSSSRTQTRPAPERAIHFGLMESGRGVSLRKLPSGFAERVREVKILATPGLDQGLEHSDAVIEDWKKSL